MVAHLVVQVSFSIRGQWFESHHEQQMKSLIPIVFKKDKTNRRKRSEMVSPKEVCLERFELIFDKPEADPIKIF